MKTPVPSLEIAVPLLAVIVLGCAAATEQTGKKKLPAPGLWVSVSHSIAKPGKKDALLLSSSRLASGTEAAEGMLQYQLYSGLGEDGPVTVVSVWQTGEDEQRFIASETGQRLHGPELEREMDAVTEQSWTVASQLIDSWWADPMADDAEEPGVMHAFAVHAIARPSDKNRLIQASVDANQASRNAEGLVQYMVFSAEEEDGPVTSISVWSDAEAFAAFLRSDAGKGMQAAGVTPQMDALSDRAWTVESELVANWQRSGGGGP